MIALLDKLNYDPAVDRVIFAGDLVDRGPHSGEVVKWMRGQHENGRKVDAIMGNHDDKHFRYFKHALKKREHPNYRIPMRPFSMDKLQAYNSMDDADLEFLGSLEHMIYIPESDRVVVHAGLEPKKDLWHQ
jgi:predicted MPP superfamily phosphohydrolase